MHQLVLRQRRLALERIVPPEQREDPTRARERARRRERGLQRADATLLLLKHGANPYAIEKNTGKDAVDKGLTGFSVLSGKACPGELGGCSDFWARLDGLCVARSPPAVDWARLSVGTRIRRVIAKF